MRKRTNDHLRQNIALARKWVGKLEKQNYQALINLSQEYGFSIALGDLILLDGKWYVTHTGLLRIAQRRRCSGIKTVIQDRLSDPSSRRWIFKATVYKTSTSRGFVGYGDADPSNVSSLVHGAEMASPKLALSTARSARPTASGSVRSKNSDGPPGRIRLHHPISAVHPQAEIIMETTTASLASAIACAS
jgi:hypothetical protein